MSGCSCPGELIAGPETGRTAGSDEALRTSRTAPAMSAETSSSRGDLCLCLSCLPGEWGRIDGPAGFSSRKVLGRTIKRFDQAATRCPYVHNRSGTVSSAWVTELRLLSAACPADGRDSNPDQPTGECLPCECHFRCALRGRTHRQPDRRCSGFPGLVAIR